MRDAPPDTPKIGISSVASPSDLLIVPRSVCLICGTEGERNGGVCSRCGTTDADVRAVLRAGATAYAHAYSDAVAGRFEKARENLNHAAALGLAHFDTWHTLSDLIDTVDPSVSAEDNAAYTRQRQRSEQGRFNISTRFSYVTVPAAQELQQLCTRGIALQQQALQGSLSRYALIGAVCAVLGFSLSARVAQRSLTSLPENHPGVPHDPVRQTKVRPPSSAPIVQAKATALRGTPAHPYPERLTRRYYNDALAAYRAKNYIVAKQLADQAVYIGRKTYLFPHTLLLRAQIADTLGQVDATQLWARVATDAPHSSYAPLGLLRAAQRSRKKNGKQTGMALYLQKLFDNYPSSKETAVARRQFSPILLVK